MLHIRGEKIGVHGICGRCDEIVDAVDATECGFVFTGQITGDARDLFVDT